MHTAGNHYRLMCTHHLLYVHICTQHTCVHHNLCSTALLWLILLCMLYFVHGGYTVGTWWVHGGYTVGTRWVHTVMCHVEALFANPTVIIATAQHTHSHTQSHTVTHSHTQSHTVTHGSILLLSLCLPAAPPAAPQPSPLLHTRPSPAVSSCGPLRTPYTTSLVPAREGGRD